MKPKIEDIHTFCGFCGTWVDKEFKAHYTKPLCDLSVVSDHEWSTDEEVLNNLPDWWFEE